MSLTRQWLETKPASTDKIKDFPAEAQARWKDIREQLNSGGHVCDGTSPLTEQGRHAVNASGVASPDIYKSDRTTPIWQWADAAATLAAGYPLNGSKNIPEATMGDYSIGIDAKGFKRALQEFAIFESNPVDTKVNVKAGVYFVGAKSAYHAGGQLTIGTAPLTLPAAGNKAQYAVVISSAGTLTARKGTEVAFAGSTVSPDVQLNDNLVGYIEIRADSVSFSMVTSGVNAFFVRDGRTIIKVPQVGIVQIGQATSGSFVESSSVALSKSITTLGGIVLVIASAIVSTGVDDLSIGRSGVPIASATSLLSGALVTLVGLEAIAAGTYTYQLRQDPGALTAARLWVAELNVTAFV